MKHGFVDISPGVCGDNTHRETLEGRSEGMVRIRGISYRWYGACPVCIAEKLKEIKSDARKQAKKEV